MSVCKKRQRAERLAKLHYPLNVSQIVAASYEAVTRTWLADDAAFRYFWIDEAVPSPTLTVDIEAQGVNVPMSWDTNRYDLVADETTPALTEAQAAALLQNRRNR